MSDEPTAPRPRVEGERVAEIARVVGTMRVGTLDGIEPLAPTYGEVATIAADWQRLTAEVARLTKELKQAESERAYHEADATLIREEHDNVVRVALDVDDDIAPGEYPNLVVLERLREACAKYRAALAPPHQRPGGQGCLNV